MHLGASGGGQLAPDESSTGGRGREGGREGGREKVMQESDRPQYRFHKLRKSVSACIPAT